MISERLIIDSRDINRSELVGKEIKILSEQYPGRTLDTKVVGIQGDNLVIDRSGSSGLVNELINNQDIEVQISYKGESIVFNSRISIPRKGMLQIPITGCIFPETSRRFKRLEIVKYVKLTYFNDTSISSVRLNRLRWIETKTINISGGGVLVEVPADLTRDFYMILHLGLEGLDIPKLLVGRVRHSRLGTNNRYNVGVEFMISEDYLRKLPKSLIRNLPVALFGFNDKARGDLATFLVEEYKRISE